MKITHEDYHITSIETKILLKHVQNNEYFLQIERRISNRFHCYADLMI